MEGAQIDLTTQNFDFPAQLSMYNSNKADMNKIEDVLEDPVKLHQKLLQNGVIDHDYFEFLTELEESGKYETSNINQVEEYYTKEINRLKAFYETQIQQIKEESEQAISSLQEETQALNEKCHFLTEQVNELQENQKKFPPKPNIIKNSFSRRGSENIKIGRKINNSWKQELNSSKDSKNSQTREQDDLKLKKKIDELNNKAKRLKTQWEGKLEIHKKEIKDLKTENNELKSEIIQQKSKHQKELNKSKDLVKRMERDMKNLKRGIEDVEKEKINLKKKLSNNLETKSIDNRVRKRLDLSKSTTRSQNDLDLFSKRKDSTISKRNNKLFSSTTSLQPFNLLKSFKNLSKKGNNGK